VSDFGISWVESRDGHELVKLEGAEAIQELGRMAERLRLPQPSAGLELPAADWPQAQPLSALHQNA